MHTITERKLSVDDLSYLPSFAQYILDHKLSDFVNVLLKLAHELHLPLLNVLGNFTQDEIHGLTTQTHQEYLSRLAQNKVRQEIEEMQQKWAANQLPNVDKDDITTEDITLINYMRKRALTHFIPDYCKDATQIVELIKEIDIVLMRSETVASQTYVRLLKEKLEEQSYFTDKITNTTPGIIYLFNLDTLSLFFINERVRDFFDSTQEEMAAVNDNIMTRIIHPDDLQPTMEVLKKFENAEDGEIRTLENRLKNGKGEYVWMRNYMCVFKRDDMGKPVQIIGNILNINAEKLIAEQLQKSESLYKQTEVLANMGNWNLDVRDSKLKWSDQLYKIYGLEPQSEEITTDRFISFLHPADKPQVEKSIKEGYKEDYPDYTFRIITQQGIEKTLRSVARVQRNENGQLSAVSGFEQDITEQQNLIKQLKKSEKLYKQTQALAQIGNWTWHIKENRLEWSDEVYKIFGLTPQSEIITYDAYLDFVHQDDKATVTELHQKSIEKQESWDHIHCIVWRDGSHHHIKTAGELLNNDQQALIMIGTAQDVTRQKEFERQLSRQQDFIQKIADATPSVIAVYNVHTGQYVFINEGLKKLLGYEREELFQEGTGLLARLIHPDDMAETEKKNAQALEEFNKPENLDRDDIVIEFKYRLKHKNGEWRWFHTFGTIFDRNGEGEIEHVLNISLDITSQMQAEERLAEQELFIKHIADASPTILYLYDAEEDSIIYINREIFFVLGYTPEDILELKAAVKSLYHPEDFYLLPERKGSGRKFKQHDSMIQYECRMKHKEGEWRWFLIREVVFKTDEKGKVLQVLGAALDINRRKQMEKTLLNNSFLLEQSNASLEEFAYVASHDLKEPLRKISTFGDRLIATQLNKLSDDGKIYLKKIVDASQRMQVMITDLLSISMISGNKSFEPYSLQTVLDEVLQTLEYKIEQRNAIIQSDTLPVINIIPSQFRQLFQNLLSNSLKFVREKEQPVVKITYQVMKPEEVKEYQLSKSNLYHKIELIDNGIGFENEYAGKIFAIFQRLHGRSEYEGTGIGLAICKKIAEHHGGIIYASGIPDKGATFTIIVPE